MVLSTNLYNRKNFFFFNFKFHQYIFSFYIKLLAENETQFIKLNINDLSLVIYCLLMYFVILCALKKTMDELLENLY